MSIRLKLFLGFGALILLSGLQGGLAVKESLVLGQLVTDTYDKSLMTINFARSAQSNFMLTEVIFGKHASHGELASMDLEEFTDASELVTEDLEVARERSSNPRTIEQVEKLIRLKESWLEAAVSGIEKLSDGEDQTASNMTLMDSLQVQSDTIHEEMELLVEFASEDGFVFRQEADAKLEEVILYNSAATGAVVALGLIFAIVLGFVIARPLGKMCKIMTALADGDIKIEVKATKRSDEIGDMTRAITFFKNSLIKSEQLQREQLQAEEDKRALEERAAADRKREVLAMADSLEQNVMSVVDSLTGSTDHLHELANTMTGAANQTSERSAVVATTTDETSSNMQTVASATEELSSSVGTIGQHVGESSKIAKAAVAEATATNEKIRKLESAVNKIGEVVDLINDIASQTNLLALNATIESARAGEAGRGFAVVAKEVKSLATQTANATEEIGSQIAQIQGETGEAVSAIAKISDVISKISETSTKISGAVDEQGMATREIASIVQRAAAGTQEISGNISQVNEAATETGQAANQVLDAADTLSKQGQTLRQQVDNFLNSIRAA